MVGCEGGHFAIVGFNGYVGREAELAKALATLINGAVESEAITLGGTPFVFPEPSRCPRCGGHDFQEARGGTSCATCNPPEEDDY
jgi:hypothetical protein